MGKSKSTMPKKKPLKKRLGSYKIHGTDKVVKVKAGDCVLLRPQKTGEASYVAKVLKIEADNRKNVNIKVQWYYRPEDSEGGRLQFHGAKEVFLSDHTDYQSADTIEGKCTVHSFMDYTKLQNVGTEDYFSRFEYNTDTQQISAPDRVAVYCKCDMPYNPDDLMMQCDGCENWFHPSCVGMTIKAAKKLQSYMCADCEAKTKAEAKLQKK